jgi:hypothetical protein
MRPKGRGQLAHPTVQGMAILAMTVHGRERARDLGEPFDLVDQFNTYTLRQINSYTPIVGRDRRRGKGFRVPGAVII